MAAKIPVFVSAPSILSPERKRSYERIVEILSREGLEPRALGRSDYGIRHPLQEVYAIARHCSGGVILGFAHSEATEVVTKPGTAEATTSLRQVYPSPWNNLEAGILYSLKLPLMVFREDGISGGVFDDGASGLYLQSLPIGDEFDAAIEQIQSVTQSWVSGVRQHYRAY